MLMTNWWWQFNHFDDIDMLALFGMLMGFYWHELSPTSVSKTDVRSSPQVWKLTTTSMFSTIAITKLIHFHTNISSIFIAHDTVTTIEMIFNSDPVSNIQNCIWSCFDHHSNCFVAWNESHAMTIIQNFLKNVLEWSLYRLCREIPVQLHSISRYWYQSHKLKLSKLLFGPHHRPDRWFHGRVFIRDLQD